MILYRPDYAKKNYQGLRNNLSALEPPIWMSRQNDRYHLEEATIVDEVIGDVLKYSHNDNIQIFPSGNNPCSNQENNHDMQVITGQLARKAYVRMRIEFDEMNINKETTWDGFDLNKYKAHNWHCWGGKPRSPYGVLFTSIGCPFSCKFCCINSFYGGYEKRDLDVILKDLDILAKLKVKNIKIIDELFICDLGRVESICDYIIANGYDFNIWAYARISEIPAMLLRKLEMAGIRWLCLGIESGNQSIRAKNGKGNHTNTEIKNFCKGLKERGIHIVANYIFGFYEDSFETMSQTLDLALEIKGEYSNFYSMMPYEGSRIYYDSIKKGFYVATTSNELSQYGYNSHPLQTKFLSSKAVLLFRDNAFYKYYSDRDYLFELRTVFGKEVLEEVKEMTKIKLKRKLYE